MRWARLPHAFPVTLYTAAHCAPCASARNLLVSRGIPFTERTVGSNEDIEALKRLSGNTSLPFGSIGNQQLQGFSDSEWTQYLNAAGYPHAVAVTAQLPSPGGHAFGSNQTRRACGTAQRRPHTSDTEPRNATACARPRTQQPGRHTLLRTRGGGSDAQAGIGTLNTSEFPRRWPYPKGTPRLSGVANAYCRHTPGHLVHRQTRTPAGRSMRKPCTSKICWPLSGNQWLTIFQPQSGLSTQGGKPACNLLGGHGNDFSRQRKLPQVATRLDSSAMHAKRCASAATIFSTRQRRTTTFDHVAMTINFVAALIDIHRQLLDRVGIQYGNADGLGGWRSAGFRAGNGGANLVFNRQPAHQ